MAGQVRTEISGDLYLQSFEKIHDFRYTAIFFESKACRISKKSPDMVNSFQVLEWRGYTMIEVTRLNDSKIIINADLIERIEESPDTVITLTSGNKIVVKESRQEVKNLVILYKKEIFNREL